MKKIHNKDQYEGQDIYSMKKYVDKRKLMLNVGIAIITMLTLILVIYYVVDTTKRIKAEKEFEKQVLQIKEELEEQKKVEEEKKQREAKIPKLTEQGKENIKNIYNSENKKRAFLTFDDGPSTNTNDILNLLQERNIKASFFVLGIQVENMPETLLRIYEEGHYIANHGYSHVYSNIYEAPEKILEEYNRCNKVVSETLNVPEYNSHLFRFPGGSVGGKYAKIKNQAIPLLEQNEILYIDWNSLTGDSEKRDPTEEYLMNNLINTTNGKNSVVVLMHDSPAKRITVDVLPKVIDYLQQQGYEFENFYSLIK